MSIIAEENCEQSVFALDTSWRAEEKQLNNAILVKQWWNQVRNKLFYM